MHRIVDIQSLKSSDNSLKDEWLVIVFSLIFIAHFVPELPGCNAKRMGYFMNIMIISG